MSAEFWFDLNIPGENTFIHTYSLNLHRPGIFAESCPDNVSPSKGFPSLEERHHFRFLIGGGGPALLCNVSLTSASRHKVATYPMKPHFIQ